MDGDDVQHDLVHEYQLPALPLQQHPGAGQRPRGGRRRGAPCPASPVVLRAETIGRDDHGHRGRRRPAETRHAVAAGDVRLQRGRQDRHLPRPLGARAACSRSPSTCSTPARATSPRAGSSPTGAPARPGRRLQDQDRLQPRRRHPEARPRPARNLVEALAARGPRRRAASSGISTTGGSTSDARVPRRVSAGVRSRSACRVALAAGRTSADRLSTVVPVAVEPSRRTSRPISGEQP